jgi:ResB-like family
MVVHPRRLFQPPWEFRESALFTAVAVIAGFAVQFAASGRGVAMLHLPFNAIALALFALLVLSIGLGFREAEAVKWFGGIPLGLCLIFAIALLSLIGGVVPQTALEPGSLGALLGLNRIFSSWPFALIILLFLGNLGLSLSWRLVPFKLKNLQFILFHAGFWIALSCAIFGSPDIQRLVMKVDEGGKSNVGYSMERDTMEKVPFSIFLHDFSLEEYPSQLFLFDPRSGQPLDELSKSTTLVHKGVKASWKGVDVEVLDFIPYALPGKNALPEPADRTAGIPFAKVRISTNAAPRDEWITTGSPMVDTRDAQAGSLYLGIRPGAPKAFRSTVTVHDDDGQQKTATLEVNHPITFMGWKLYQMSYDNKAGRWSKYSVIEVIRDPWLPAVYLGFFMIMAGNLLFFWNGIKRTEGAS